jgi:hypothetical protein
MPTNTVYPATFSRMAKLWAVAQAAAPEFVQQLDDRAAEPLLFFPTEYLEQLVERAPTDFTFGYILGHLMAQYTVKQVTGRY